jgi:hypothetical protein
MITSKTIFGLNLDYLKIIFSSSIDIGENEMKNKNLYVLINV